MPNNLRPSNNASIPLGVHSQLYRNFPWPRALEGIARAGYELVGIGYAHAGRLVIEPDATPGHIAIVRQQVEAAGLRPAVAYSSPSAPRSYATHLQRMVEVASELGCPFVPSYGPSPYRDGVFGQRKREMAYFLECHHYFATLREIAPLAERLGITIVLKPHSGVTGTGQDLTDVVRWLGLPNVRVNYDAGNILHFEGIAPEEDVPACANLVRLLSIKDHRGGRGSENVPLPGTGDIDHVMLLRILFDAGFTGPCVVERIDALDTPAEIDAALTTARRNIENAIAAARLP